MVNAYKLTNGVIDNVAIFANDDDIFDGWVKVTSVDQIKGAIDNGDGTFSPPVSDDG